MLRILAWDFAGGMLESALGERFMTLPALWRNEWLNAALGFLYPEACQFCAVGRATPAEGFVCADCSRAVRFIQPPFCDRCGLPFDGGITTRFVCANCNEIQLHFRYARSAVVAREVVLEAIHRYKYHRGLWLEPFLAGLFIRQAAPELARSDWDWLVPVPLFSAKQREREFNQAERFARRLSQATGIPVHNLLLKRVTATKTQTLLTRHERVGNVRNAFLLRRPQSLKGVRMVLIDDVFTTGATINACAKVLRQAGAADVCVWTVARGI